MNTMEQYDAIVVGGGPAGATAAGELAEKGHRVLLLHRTGRIKPCGGAVPPKLLEEFDIPESLLEAKVNLARMISPQDKQVDMAIGGFVGMVDRCSFDRWLRERAIERGADYAEGIFKSLARDPDGNITLHYVGQTDQEDNFVKTKVVIGADGANSSVRKQSIPKAEKVAHVFAYHEIIESPQERSEQFAPNRCDVYYQGKISPDFYGWVFPHGKQTSIGTGTAVKGFSLRQSVQRMRKECGMENNRVIRKEGAPLPLKPLRRWDNGRDVVVIGDAAGAVAPSSGEGIYYAMSCGRFAAVAVNEFFETGKAKALKKVRKLFMKSHGRVFFILGIMQRFWYVSDKRREKFVKICRDPDVQRLTWDAYMNKRLVRAKPSTHLRIFFKDLAHLVGLNPR